MDINITDLLSKQQITEQIYRYCRGVDRLDREMVLGVWHDDALIDFGDFFKGTPSQFVNHVWQVHAAAIARSHQVTNILIDVSDEKAVSEAYVIGGLRLMDSSGVEMQSLGWSRYLDRWSRRQGRWAIDHRICLMDFADLRPAQSPSQTGRMPHLGRVDGADPSFAFLRKMKG